MTGRGYILRVAEEGVVFLANLDGATTELYRDHVLATSMPKNPIPLIVPPNSVRSRGSWASKPTYLGNQDVVTLSNAHGDLGAIAVNGTRANSENLGNVLLLDAALREEDPGGSLGLGLDALDQDTVEKGSEALDVTEDRLYSKAVLC